MLRLHACALIPLRATPFIAATIFMSWVVGLGHARADNQQTTPPAEATPRQQEKAASGTKRNGTLQKEDKKLQSDGADDIEQVRQRLNGDWNLVGGINQGRKLSPKDFEGSHVIINDNTIVVLDGKQKELYKASFELEISTDDEPHRINMSSDVPDASRAIAFGILQFTKSGWKLAYALPESERPQEFVSPAGSKIMLFEMASAANKESPVPVDDNLPKQ